MLRFLQFVTLILLCLVSNGSSDLASDRAECTDQLVGLATCLPYVGGEAKSPTPDCCAGFKQVTEKSIKCLCVLVKDRNDPSLGLKVNVSLALALPAKCNAPANVSTCPRLLNLPQNSQEAKEFNDFENALEGKGSPRTGTVTKNSTINESARESQVSCGWREKNMRVEMDASKIWSVLLVPLLLLMG